MGVNWPAFVAAPSRKVSLRADAEGFDLERILTVSSLLLRGTHRPTSFTPSQPLSLIPKTAVHFFKMVPTNAYLIGFRTLLGFNTAALTLFVNLLKLEPSLPLSRPLRSLK